MIARGYMLVEGHGEVGAADNLITRLRHERQDWRPWAQALRWKNLHLRRGIEQGVGYVRAQRDAGALLILRDEDDKCPRQLAPIVASWVRELDPPFPVAMVLLHREYEVLFLPCLAQMAGRPIKGDDDQERAGFPASTRYTGDWEARRGVKEWLSEQLPPGRIYKPALDQLPLTRLIDIPTLRAANVPCFGTLERALGFLIASFGSHAGVYPPSV